MLLPSDVFDQPQPVGNKKIEFHISTDMPSAFKKDLEKEQNREEQNYGKHILVFNLLYKNSSQSFCVRIKFLKYRHFFNIME